MCAKVATTQWSQVLAARDGSDTQARAALESPCQTYWQPLYAYIRHQGSDPDEARDLTQGYFAEFLEKDFLADVNPDKGRFRSFLLASLRNFLSHERERSRALKRGGGALTLSFDTQAGETRYANQPSVGASAGPRSPRTLPPLGRVPAPAPSAKLMLWRQKIYPGSFLP